MVSMPRFLALLLLLSCFLLVKNEPLPRPLNHKELPLNDDYSLIKKIKASSSLKTAFDFTLELTDEKLQIQQLQKSAYKALGQQSDLFLEINTALRSAARKGNELDALGESFWNDAEYYWDKNDYINAYNSYSRALTFFNQSGNNNFVGKMQYNLAVLKSYFKDIIGSEILALQALENYKKEGKSRSQILVYNHLSNLNRELEEFELSLANSQKALAILDKHPQPNKFYRQGVLFNIGLTYKKQENYAQAKVYFQRALNMNPKIKTKHPRLYAQLLGNNAFSDFKMGNLHNVEQRLQRALKIQDSINNSPSMIFNYMELSKFKFYQKDTVVAIQYAKKANQLAKQSQNVTEFLNSLKLLTEIDNANATTYLNKHVFMNDSLQHIERSLREKFSRLDFEGQQFKKLSEELSNKNRIYGILLVSVLALLVLIYFVYRERLKNERLQFNHEKKLINEELFFMSQEQQDKFQEGMHQERERISEELHDGVLSSLFGTRMSMGFLKSEQTEKFDTQLKDLQSIEREIRYISHNLRSDIIEDTSTFEVFENLIEKQCQLGHLNYTIETNDMLNWNRLSIDLKLNLFRILQEVLSNILKHSQAKNVYLVFNEYKDTLVVKIEDDGVGFDINKKHKGIGLTNIISRIKAFQGHYSFVSHPPKGTEINITLCINPEAPHYEEKTTNCLTH